MSYGIAFAAAASSSTGSDPCVLAATGIDAFPLLLLLGAVAAAALGALLMQRGRRRAVATAVAGLLAVTLVGAGAISQTPPAMAATAGQDCVDQPVADDTDTDSQDPDTDTEDPRRRARSSRTTTASARSRRSEAVRAYRCSATTRSTAFRPRAQR